MGGGWREGESERGLYLFVFSPCGITTRAGCAPEREEGAIAPLWWPPPPSFLSSDSSHIPSPRPVQDSGETQLTQSSQISGALPSACPSLVSSLFAKPSSDSPGVPFGPAQTLTDTQVLRCSHSTEGDRPSQKQYSMLYEWHKKEDLGLRPGFKTVSHSPAV